MENYKLSSDLNQKIVDGIMEGYREYLDVRREKSTMKVSGAYAWVKGNHIDHHVAATCESYGVERKLAKAGLTWQYLQFKHGDDETLFIVKNARYFNPDQVNRGKDALGNSRSKKISYMDELMKINSNINFNINTPENQKDSVQLELVLLENVSLTEKDNEDISKINIDFKRFYIVSYEIDEGQQISEIGLWMPNPVNNKAYHIDDLTAYLNSDHIIEIEPKLKEVLTNKSDSTDYLDAQSFGIVLDAEEKEE